MKRSTRWTLSGIAAGLLAAGIGGGIALAGGAADSDRPITGPDRTRAEQAALAHTGGGRVTGTEVGDEESRYEVEVTLPDGRQVDVQLDENFKVVGASADDESGDGPDEGG